MDCIAKNSDSSACPTVPEHLPFFSIFDNNSKTSGLTARGTENHNLKVATAREVNAGNLPSLTLDHPIPVARALPVKQDKHDSHDKHEHNVLDGLLAVGSDLVKGAVNEVVHHPGRVALSFAIGAGTAAIASVVSAPVLLAATLGGAAYGAYQIARHAPTWYHAVEGVMAPEHRTAAELAHDHQVIQDFGGGATDIAAGIAGGIAYRAAAASIHAALAESAEAHPIKSATTSSTNASSTGDNGSGQHAAGATAAANGDGGSGHQAVIQPGNDGGHHAAAAVGGAQPDGGKVPLEAAAKPVAAAMTPEEAVMARSVETSQGIFNAAKGRAESGVIESTKQLYRVHFEQVTEDAGRRLITLENRTTGALVPKGAWIATRLDAAGKPVIEDGITNAWSIQPDKLLKTYQVTPEAIQNGGSFIAATRTDGPSVHMVQLDKPLEIMTGWGSMKAKIGDWLANYDFNGAENTPGKDYAIVSAESYRQTYQPKIK